MPTASTLGCRIKSLLLALAAFGLMILLPNMVSGVILGVIESVALRTGGYEALAEAYGFLIDNLNLFSALVYALFGLPVFAWVLVMRRHGRGATQMVPSVERLEQVSFCVRGVARSAWFDAAFLGIGMQFVTTFIMILVMVLLPAAMEEYQELVGDSGLLDYGIMWFISTIVLPPLVEETGFRGLGLTYLKRAGVPFVVANVLQALAFGLFHGNLVQGVYTFVLGLFMGYVVHRSGSVVPAMLMHAVYNLMGTLGSDVLYTLVPWLPFWVELAVGAVLSLGAMISLHDRGGRPAASS